MKNKGTLISLLSATCLVAFGSVAPAQAGSKPCCYHHGQYSNSSVSTCERINGGRVVPREYCERAGYNNGYYNNNNDEYYYGSRPNNGGINFSIQLGGVVFAYNDGYYDNNRRWHGWRSTRERDWYRNNHRGSFFAMNRDRDNDRHRRDWRDGRRNDWRNN